MQYTIEHCRKIFENVDHPSLRLWKKKLSDGRMIQNKHKIMSAYQLYRFLEGDDVIALYYSVSFYGMPHLARGNLSTLQENAYLYSNIILDFDAIDGDLEQARKDAVKALTFMENNNILYRLTEVTFSGTKGFHLVYSLMKRPKIKDRQERFSFYNEETLKIRNQIIKLNLKTYDYKVTEIFRVYAVPYSFKANKNQVIPLTLEELKTKDLYKKKTSNNHRFGEPSKGNDRYFTVAKGKKRGRPKVRPAFIIFKYLDNMVKGTKANYVTVLEHYQYNKNLLMRLQKTYNLSDFYVFKIGSKIFSVNFKCVSFERLSKILKASKSLNLNTLINRKHIPLIISDVKDNKGKVVHKLEVVDVVKSVYGLNDNHSKSHCNFFKRSYANMVGNNEQEIYEIKRIGGF